MKGLDEVMKEREELLAYCGSYCGDCLGYTGVIAYAARNFMKVLEKYKFDWTAECVFPEELKNYPIFYEVLGFMTGLKCTQICREREDSSTSCKVRKCCRDKGFYACHECDDFETCDKLKSFMKGLHTDSCLKNLRATKEIGLEAWIIKGKNIATGMGKMSPHSACAHAAVTNEHSSFPWFGFGIKT